jgi:hypothetical protein
MNASSTAATTPPASTNEQRYLEAHDQDCHGVGGNGHEGDVAEIRQAGQRELCVESERHYRVDAGDGADKQPKGGIEKVH